MLMVGKTRSLFLGFSVAAALAAPGWAAPPKSVGDGPVPAGTEAAFKERFPETRPDAISCEGFGPLCQVIAGQTVFYIDPDARHAFIGRLYDLEAKADLTEATLKSLAPVVADVSQQYTDHWSNLPWDSALVRNKGGRFKVAVFSDLHCGYCRNLSMALADAPDIEVHEFLVGMAGSEEASRAIGCANDPDDAIHTYYRTRMLPDGACDRDIVGPARIAAKALGPAMQGTPTFIRPDGAVTSGFRDIASLRAWLEAGTSEKVTQ